MRVSIEISFYPLAEHYLDPIQHFIDRLNGYAELEVSTNLMSTQLFGDYRRVMEIVTDEMQRSHREIPASVFVLKVFGADLKSRHDA